jgi:hypothetical protein
MARREKDPSSRKIIRGMAVEVSSLASLLDVELAGESEPSPIAQEPEEGATRILLPSELDESDGQEMELTPAAQPLEIMEIPAANGNGKELQLAEPVPGPALAPVEAQLPNTGSLLLRKGMSMVLEGRIKRKKPVADSAASPEEAALMQQKIERWARAGAEAQEESGESSSQPHPSSVWPPPLPSSNGEN